VFALVRSYDQAGWSSFFEGMLTATAALTGLLFIAISNNLTLILKSEHLVARAGETLGILLSLLAISALMLLPQRTQTAGIEVTVLAAVVLGTTLRSQVVAFRHADPEHPRSWHVSRIVATLPATVPAVVGGLLLILQTDGGSFWLAAAELLGVAGATSNTWVLLIEILR
jgi:heme/copper-type cytochrome/quinol oxidase subunit 4